MVMSLFYYLLMRAHAMCNKSITAAWIARLFFIDRIFLLIPRPRLVSAQDGAGDRFCWSVLERGGEPA